MMKSKRKSYNDGVIELYSEIPKATDFAAKKNARSISDLTYIAKLAFAEVSRRDQDVIFAEALGRNLTVKLKTPYLSSALSTHKVVLGQYLYDIIKLDQDRKNQELYFYLEGVRPFVE